jgi:hypothetical protein
MKKANIAQSVHTRLLELARGENQEFNHLRLCSAMERFLVRFSMSKHKTTFTVRATPSNPVCG